MMVDPKPARVPLDDYLRLDAASAEPLEYRDGRVVALAVPSGNHEQIKANLVALLARGARDAGCRLLLGGVKVVCPNGDRAIPDLGMTCDARDLDALSALGEALIAYPRLVIEILSPATAADDRGAKLDSYNAIPELTHCLRRTPDGLLAIDGPLQRLGLPHIGAELLLEDVYDGSTVPAIE